MLFRSGNLVLVDSNNPATVLASQPLSNDPVTITGADNNDVLTVDFSTFSSSNPFPSGGLTFNAGASNNGTQVITGQSVVTETYTFTNAHDGSVDVGGALIAYTGLAPIIANGDADNRVFIYTASGGTITVTAAARTRATSIAASSSRLKSAPRLPGFGLPTSSFRPNMRLFR